MRRRRVSGTRLRSSLLTFLVVSVTTSLTAACTSSGPHSSPGAGSSPSTATSTSATSTSTPAPLAIKVSAVRWRLPAPLAREAVILDGNRILVAGGLIAGDNTTAASYWLNPKNGRATALPLLVDPVHDTAGGLLAGGSPLVIAGGSAVGLDVVQQFDPKADSWSVVGHLPVPRSDLSVVTVGAALYVLGGYSGLTPAEAPVLKSTNGTSWTTVAQLRNPVRYAATAVLGKTIWVFGGERGNATYNTVQSVNVPSGKSKIVARLPQALGEAMAVPVGKVILLCGGRTANGTVSRVCRWFDPSTKSFSSAGRLPWPLRDSVPVMVGSTIYLIGGETPSLTDRVVKIQVTGLTQ